MSEVRESAVPTAAVLGGGGLAHQAVTAVLLAAGVLVGVADGAAVCVLVEPKDRDWEAASASESNVVLVTTGAPDADTVLAAVIRGADAVVEADAPSSRLVRAVEVVAAGGTELSPALMRRVADALRSHAQEDELALSLTRRERDILLSVDAGETVKQTARTLGIAPKTVENLQSRLFRKLGVRNRAQAVALARSLGLLPPPDAEPEAPIRPQG
jgi:DNA-binding NarL/FixJ family response regulator